MRAAILFSNLCVLALALPQQDDHDSHDHDSHDHDSHDHDHDHDHDSGAASVIEDVHKSLIDDYTSATVTATAAVIDDIHDSLIDEFTATAEVTDVDSESIIDEIHETMVENFTEDAAVATTAVDAVSTTPIASDTEATPPVQTTDGALKKAPVVGGVVAAALFVAYLI